ncbi:MAG: zf-TFIIB domain-containing protein [Capsulimonadales bacterium]|nr:zf-TFIIB domain-containing protein [Capsulimonadales bacterium]
MSMECPLCPGVRLQQEEVENGLTMLTCAHCLGRFLPSNTYFDWLDKAGPNRPERPAQQIGPIETSEPNQAKRCPDCSGILVAYKVGRDTGFSLDRCFHCGGIWFDANEWETLRARNLHDDIHRIFSKAWQEDVRKTELVRQKEQRLRQTFGSADYDELVRVKQWLDEHPKSREMYAFLMYEANIVRLP